MKPLRWPYGGGSLIEGFFLAAAAAAAVAEGASFPSRLNSRVGAGIEANKDILEWNSKQIR